MSWLPRRCINNTHGRSTPACGSRRRRRRRLQLSARAAGPCLRHFLATTTHWRWRAFIMANAVDIDFVLHESDGPRSWSAQAARPGLPTERQSPRQWEDIYSHCPRAHRSALVFVVCGHMSVRAWIIVWMV